MMIDTSSKPKPDKKLLYSEITEEFIRTAVGEVPSLIKTQ